MFLVFTTTIFKSNKYNVNGLSPLLFVHIVIKESVYCFNFSPPEALDSQDLLALLDRQDLEGLLVPLDMDPDPDPLPLLQEDLHNSLTTDMVSKLQVI